MFAFKPRRNRRLSDRPAATQAVWAAWRRARPALARLAVAMVGLGVAGVVGLGAVHYVVHLGPLQVHGIEINGLVRTTRTTILTSAGLKLNQPLLAIDLAHVVQSIEALPWVRHATVRRQLPDRLRIEVQEHEAKAAAMIGELWLINPDGEPFKRFSSADGLALPMLTGIRAQPIAERAYAAQPALVARLHQGLTVVDALMAVRDDLYSVDELHYDADLGWSSVLLLGRAYARSGAARPAATVHLGGEPERRLKVLTYALGQLADRREVPQIIWVAHEHQEGRIQVQLAAAGDAPAREDTPGSKKLAPQLAPTRKRKPGPNVRARPS